MYRFFGRFPTMAVNDKTVTDITRRIILSPISKQMIVAYEKHQIVDGETPENLANAIYGDPGYHWLIFIANDIINPYYDWPLSQNELRDFVADKWDDPHAIHHYEASNFSTDLPEGTIVDVNYPQKVAISNFEYEEKINEARREIRIIKREFLIGIVNEFEQKIIE
jgi:hypothetical protein